MIEHSNMELSVELTEQKLVNLIESLLFVSTDPLDLQKIAATLEVELDAVQAALNKLILDCENRGIRILSNGNNFQMVTAPECNNAIQKLLGTEIASKLSTAALETLAIIAYEQPVTKTKIENIRGVNCDRVIASLLNRGLVIEVGRLETVGRPVQYGTSFEFLQYFGLKSLEDLPPLERNYSLESN